MTKFIILASTDADINVAATQTNNDATNYWHGAHLLNLGSNTASYHLVEVALEAAQHNPFGSLENVAIIAHGNNQEIGNAAGSYAWTVQQFAPILDTIIPSAYITYASSQSQVGVFFSVCSQGVDNFATSLCLQLGQNNQLINLWIYSHCLSTAGTISPPAGVDWQACQVAYEPTSNAAKILKWTSDSIDKKRTNESPCSSIDSFLNTLHTNWGVNILDKVFHTDIIKNHILSHDFILPSVQCFLKSNYSLPVIINSNSYKEALCSSNQNAIKDYIIFEGKLIELAGKSIANFMSDQIMEFCGS